MVRTWGTQFTGTSRKGAAARGRVMWMDRSTFCLSSSRTQMYSRMTLSLMSFSASLEPQSWRLSSQHSQLCIASPKIKRLLTKLELSSINSRVIWSLIRVTLIMKTLMRSWLFRHASTVSICPGSSPRYSGSNLLSMGLHIWTYHKTLKLATSRLGKEMNSWSTSKRYTWTLVCGQSHLSSSLRDSIKEVMKVSQRMEVEGSHPVGHHSLEESESVLGSHLRNRLSRSLRSTWVNSSTSKCLMMVGWSLRHTHYIIELLI